LSLVFLHSLGSRAKGFAYFHFEFGRDNAMKQLLLFDRALDAGFYKLVDVANIVIRHQLNPGKRLELQEDVGVHSSGCKDLDQILRSIHQVLQ